MKSIILYQDNNNNKIFINHLTVTTHDGLTIRNDISEIVYHQHNKTFQLNDIFNIILNNKKLIITIFKEDKYLHASIIPTDIFRNDKLNEILSE